MELERLDIKIEKFYRKYYLKQFFYNLFSGAAAFSLLLLIISLFAFFVGFETWQRQFFFIVWLAVAVFSIGFVVLPLLRMFGVFDRLEYHKLSSLLGVYFPAMQDKLINIVELRKELQHNSNELVQASLSQKSAEILPLPILQVPLLSFPLRPFLFMLSSFAVFSILLLSVPNFYERGTLPILDYTRPIVIEAPYQVKILNSSLDVKRGTDFELRVQVEGDYLPSDLQVNFGGNSFYLRKLDSNIFIYRFKKVNSSFPFYLSAYRFQSTSFQLNALAVPSIMQMQARLQYPSYTGLESKNFNNKGDFDIPEGTKIHWTVGVGNTDSLLFMVDTVSKSLVPSNNLVQHSHRFVSNATYSFLPKNEHFTDDSALLYNITVRKDEFPEMQVRQLPDSTRAGTFFFNGLVADDYGFSKLQFHLQFDSAGVAKKRSYSLPINRNLSTTEFFHLFNFTSIGASGTNIKYFFSIADNDAVNGAKTSYSPFFNFFVPSKDDLKRMSNEQRQANVKKMEESLKLAKELKEDIERLKQSLKTENLDNFQKKEMIKNIREKQDMLQKMLNEQIQKEEELIGLKEEFDDEKSKELLEKQKQINKLAEQLLDDELKDLLKQLEEMQEKGDQQQMENIADKLDMNMEDMEKQLDRNLEMLKRFQVEEKLSDLQYEMENLALQQEKIAKENQEKNVNEQEMQEQQKQIESKVDDIRKEYDKMLDLNKDLKSQMNLDSLNKEFDEMKKNQQSANDKMQKSSKKKQSKAQKKAAEQMKQVAEKMQQMLQKMQDTSMEVNEEEMRQLLDNLVWYSLEQERLMFLLRGLEKKDPRYNDFTIQQKQLHANFEVMKDSLYSLAERSMQIKKPIFKQMKELEYQQRQVENLFQDRKSNQIMQAQQRITTAANELALLFDEVLDQLQNMPMGSGGQKKKSSKKKKKKGNSKGEMPSMRKQQEQLKKQLQDMLQQMKSGKMGKKQMSKKLAQMYGKQETLRSKIQELMQKGKLSPKEQRMLNEIQKLSEDLENDLINKRISPLLLQRQQQIITRMLEAEKSMNEREQEKKREAKENTREYITPQKVFEKEKNQKQGFPTILRKQSMELNPYYKNVFKNYIKQLEKNGN